MSNQRSIEATGEFSEYDLESFKKFRKENGRYPVLNYIKSGVTTDYRITYIKGQQIWLRQMKLIDPEHLRVVDSKDVDHR